MSTVTSTVSATVTETATAIRMLQHPSVPSGITREIYQRLVNEALQAQVNGPQSLEALGWALASVILGGISAVGALKYARSQQIIGLPVRIADSPVEGNTNWWRKGLEYFTAMTRFIARDPQARQQVEAARRLAADNLRATEQLAQTDGTLRSTANEDTEMVDALIEADVSPASSSQSARYTPARNRPMSSHQPSPQPTRNPPQPGKHTISKRTQSFAGSVRKAVSPKRSRPSTPSCSARSSTPSGRAHSASAMKSFIEAADELRNSASPHNIASGILDLDLNSLQGAYFRAPYKEHRDRCDEIRAKYRELQSSACSPQDALRLRSSMKNELADALKARSRDVKEMEASFAQYRAQHSSLFVQNASPATQVQPVATPARSGSSKGKRKAVLFELDDEEKEWPPKYSPPNAEDSGSEYLLSSMPRAQHIPSKFGHFRPLPRKVSPLVLNTSEMFSPPESPLMLTTPQVFPQPEVPFWDEKMSPAKLDHENAPTLQPLQGQAQDTTLRRPTKRRRTSSGASASPPPLSPSPPPSLPPASSPRATSHQASPPDSFPHASLPSPYLPPPPSSSPPRSPLGESTTPQVPPPSPIASTTDRSPSPQQVSPQKPQTVREMLDLENAPVMQPPTTPAPVASTPRRSARIQGASQSRGGSARSLDSAGNGTGSAVSDTPSRTRKGGRRKVSKPVETTMETIEEAEPEPEQETTTRLRRSPRKQAQTPAPKPSSKKRASTKSPTKR
ncbi:hypothetical protein CC80DRAFT_589677 [Byssothecium circinans]|uniref:Uncharacterized protein n=1 Tax=Byssothecium circinans TaxID=147558 RepID=A0A6A5UJL9_9PLEO|nr:hypothetical protein CC80DRAFT_589677 [Byssothecium circinans]